MSVIEVGLSCLSGSNMWMGSGGRWAAEVGAEDTAPVLSTVLAGPAAHMACMHAPYLPQCPCKPVLQGPGAHGMHHSRAQPSGVTPWSGAPHWPHRGDPPALQMDIIRHFCPRQSLQFAACPSPGHLHAYMHGQWLKHGLLPALGHHRDGKWSTFVPVWGHGCEGPGGMSRERKRARMAFFSREMMCGRTLPCLGCLGTSKQHRLWETGL